MEENSVNSIRLNKAISDTGFCSRRGADKIIEEGRASAEAMIATAREDVARMVEQTAIVQAARDEAQRILDEARDVAEDERREVEAYIDGRLATLEVILTKTMDAVARGRERLEGADDKDVLSQLNADD